MLLAVDTSTPQIGLALYDGSQVLAETLWTSKARHTVELAQAVADILSHSGIKTNELKALGVAIGPGSFTSLRVGLSFVKGLAFAQALPVIGINTLDVVAAGQPASDLPLVCVLPAGRGRLAVCWYEFKISGWQPHDNAIIRTAEALSDDIQQETLVSGDLNTAERQFLRKNKHIRMASPAFSTRRPAILAELAYARWQSDSVDDIASLAPIYLHLAESIPDATPAAPAATNEV